MLDDFIEKYAAVISEANYPSLDDVHKAAMQKRYESVTEQNVYTYAILPFTSGINMVVYTDQNNCVESVEFKTGEFGIIALTEADIGNFSLVWAYYGLILTCIDQSITLDKAMAYMAELSNQTGELRKLDVSKSTRIILRFTKAEHSLHIYINGEYEADSEESATNEKVNAENLQDALQGYWAYKTELGSLDVIKFNEKKVYSWIYPGCGDRTRTITQIEQNNDEFKVVVHYPAEEYMGDFYPASDEIYYISSSDNFKTNLTIRFANYGPNNYTLIGRTVTEYENYIATHYNLEKG